MFSAKYAIKTVSRRKRRNLLTVIGIALGVAMIASAQIAGDTLINSFNELTFQDLGKIDVIVRPSTLTIFNESVYEILINNDNVAKLVEDGRKGISPRIEVPAFTLYPEKGHVETDVLFIGINDTLDQHFGSLISRKSEKISLSQADLALYEIVIGDHLADSLEIDLEQNRTIVVGFTDASGNNTVNYPLTVKQIAKTEEKASYNSGDVIFLPLSHARLLYNVEPQEINTIIVDTKDTEKNSEKTVDAIKNALRPNVYDYEIVPIRDNLVKSAEEGFAFFETMIYFFISFVLATGIILIINIGIMNVEERKQTIGTLRAIGMEKKQVIFTFLSEAIILGIIAAFFGLAFGIVIGYFLAWYLTYLFRTGVEEFENFTVHILLSPRIIWISLLTGIFIVIIASIYPAIKASRVDIIETLRGIEKPKKKKAGKKSAILGSLFLFIGTFILIINQSRIPLLIGSILTIISIGLISSKFLSKKIAYNFIAISLIIISMFILLTRLEKAGDFFFLVATFILITGGILLVSINLDIITNGINRILSRFKSLRGIGMMATRYLKGKKTRSSLTFAIFTIILTMSIGMTIAAHSYSKGFEKYAEENSGGADIFATSKIPIPNTTITAMQKIKTDDETGQIEYIEPIVATHAGDPNSFLYTSKISTSENTFSTPIYALSSNLSHFSFTEDSWGKADADKELLEEAFERYGVENPWQLLAIDARDPEGRPFMLLNLLMLQLAGEGLPGDSIWLKLENGTLQEFVILSEPDNFPIQSGAFISAKQPVLAIADQVHNNLYSAFLIQTNAEKLNSKINFELAQKIEKYGNKENPQGFFYGLEAKTVWEIYENSVQFIKNIINFQNSAIVTGFFIGLLALLIVSLRSVSERKREIGMMRSIGFRQKQVVRAVFLETFLLALLALVIALINAITVSYAIFGAYLEDFQYIIPWFDISLYVALILLFSFAASWYPGRKAAQIQPSEALRYVG